MGQQQISVEENRTVQERVRIVGRRFRSQEQSVFAIISVLLGVLIVLPLGMMLFGSFTLTNPGTPSPLTSEVYTNLFGSDWFLTAFAHTLTVAIGTTALGLLIGVPLAWIVVRTNTPFVDELEIPIIIPFFLSPFLGAIAWGLLGNAEFGLINQFLRATIGFGFLSLKPPYGIIWVMALYYSPYAFLLVSGTLQNMNPELEDASRMCGGSTLQTMYRITLPIMAPSILAAALLIFVAAAGQFGVPAVLGMKTGYNVLPTRIFMMTKRFPLDFSTAAATGVFLTIITGLLVVVRNQFLKSKSYVTLSGGTRPSKLDLGKWRWAALAYVLLYVFVAVVLPIGTIIMAGFLKYWSVNITPDLFSLQNWQFILFDYPITFRATTNSIILATGGAAIGMVFATVVAWVVIRTEIPGKGVIDNLGTLPVAVPGLVMGLAYLFTGLRSPIPIYGTLAMLGIAYIARFLPYGLRATASTLRQIDPALEEVSRMCGAGLIQQYRDVTLPLLKTGFASGYIMLFVIFMRELSVSILLYSSGSEVFSVAMFDLWSDGNFSQLAVLGTLQLIVTAVGLLLLGRFAGVSVTKAVTESRT